MIEEYEEEITEYLEDANAKLKKLEKCKPSEKQSMLEDLGSDLKEVRGLLDIFNSEIQIVHDYQEQKEYQKKYEFCNQEYKRIQNQFEVIKLTGNKTQKEIEKVGKMTEEQKQKEAIKHGQKLLKGSKQRAERIKMMVGQANILVEDINDEIRSQNQRMLEMEELIKDAQSTVKRANQLVRFFARSFYKDMFMKIMIVLIALAIIGVSIATVSKNQSKSKSNNVKPTPTPTPKKKMMLRVLEAGARSVKRRMFGS